jgi:hypothetical protein
VTQYMTDIPARTGSQAVSCTACTWYLPIAYHHGHGTPQRPANADSFDRLWPHVREHIEATGHRVQIVLTTWPPLEQSSTLIGPTA